MPSPPTSPPQIPYNPPPSTAHELAIMFGFIAFTLLTTALYLIAWQKLNQRSQRREANRVAALRASGRLREKDGMGL